MSMLAGNALSEQHLLLPYWYSQLIKLAYEQSKLKLTVDMNDIQF